MEQHAFKVPTGAQVCLNEHDPDRHDGLNKDDGGKCLDDLTKELSDLQEELYGAKQHSLLVILQGPDTSGKDGTIKSVFQGITPVGLRVVSFKAPTAVELSHHFLWRIDRVLPPKGFVGIFNRSHYEDVLTPRVESMVSPDVWHRRFDAIKDFERLLVQNETIIVKFFLHISPEEQMERLLAREEEIDKAWKLSPDDWQKRAKWTQYTEAQEDAMTRCNSDESPWYIVPANRKWFRNLAVAQTLVHVLRRHREEWRTTLAQMSKQKLAELATLRASGAISD